MPGVQLGFLKFVLGLETLSFNKGATEAEARIKSLQRSMQGTADKLAGLGAKLSIGLTAPLASFAASGIKEAQETAAAMAQVNAALASMGPVAGRTAAQLSDAADSFEGSPLFEADEILKKVTANMLTFGNVAGANFDKAQQAAINLSARMGTDLQASAILVGKALNDPVKGLTSLSRAGIQFSASQKETIKSMVEGGNAAGAQAIILARLKTQYSERGVNVVGLSSPLDPGAAQTPLVPNQGGAGVANAAAALGPVSDGMARLQAVADSAGEAVTRALGGIPDLALTAQAALAEISERGLNNLVNGLGAVVAGSAKLGDVFRDTINGMIQDISRYLIKEALIKLIGFIAGGTPSAGSFGGKLIAGLRGARASGGPISAGGTYLVGERGPELFTSSRGGTIIPNGKFGSRASGHNFSIYVTAPNTGNPSRDRQTSLQHAAAIKAEINRSTARGF